MPASTPSPFPVRARQLGIPFDGTPGPLNAITDVPGLAVGHTTLISGEGSAAVRTGVTAVLPAGKSQSHGQWPGGYFSLNGNGEMTGSHWLEEAGLLEGPVMLTNTHSVGTVRDATVAWLQRHAPPGGASRFYLPVVAETYDGVLSDINGQHVRAEHAHAALDNARTGPVAEGCVGGGTGMITHKFKGGIGTSSRVVEAAGRHYTVGVLVQSNYGERRQLTIAGVPVGREITHSMPGAVADKDGSIIAVIATDAPLLPHQCKRLARRASMGLARLGSVAMHSSGDIFLAFSTQQPQPGANGQPSTWPALPHGPAIDPLFQATVEAMEEAIVNAMVAATTMTGLNGVTVHALPREELLAVLGRYGRLG